MAVTDLFARRATLSRSLRLLREFRYEQPDPARFYGALAEDTAAWSPTCGGQSTAPRRPGAPCSTSAVDRATSPQLSPAPGFTYIGVEPDPEPRCTPGRSRTTAPPPTCGRRGWRCRSRTTASTSACPPTSQSTSPSRGGWAARCCGSPNPAGWWSCRTRCGWARSAGTRPGCGITSAGSGPPGATPESTAIRRRTTTARHCSRSRPPTDCNGRPPPAPCSPHFPATTRDGRGGWCGCRCCGSSGSAMWCWSCGRQTATGSTFPGS